MSNLLSALKLYGDILNNEEIEIREIVSELVGLFPVNEWERINFGRAENALKTANDLMDRHFPLDTSKQKARIEKRDNCIRMAWGILNEMADMLNEGNRRDRLIRMTNRLTRIAPPVEDEQ